MIVLIEPPVIKNILGTITPWEVPSLSLGYLLGALKKENFDCAFIDASIEQLSVDKIIKRINQISNNVKYIGLTGNVYSAKFSLYLATKLKKSFKNTTIIMGGPYATTMYEFILKNKFVDICVLGEGEYTLIELIKRLEQKKDLEDVRGIAYLKNSVVVNNNIGEYIKNLDDLPFPAWEFFPNLKKYKNLRGVLKNPYLPIFTTRGCPYGCIWCNKNIHGFKVRARTADNVIKEIERDIKEFGIKEIAIMDDNFTFDELRTLKICYAIIEKKFNLSINLYSGVRADKINFRILKFLKYAGVSRITVGIESGNQDIIKKIGKNLDLNKVKENLTLAKKMGFITDGFFILGLPGETPSTIMQTIEFAKSLALDHAYFFTATPFPGTKLFDMWNKNGKLMNDYKYGIPFHIVEGNYCYDIENLPKGFVEKMFDYAYKSYYFRLNKIFQLGVLYLRLFVKYRSISEIKWLVQQFLFFLKKKGG